MTAQPIRFDRMQAGIVALLDALTPDSVLALWGNSRYPRDSGPAGLVVARMLSGVDDALLRGGASTPLVSLPLTATFTVEPAPAEGAGVVLRASGLKWDYTVGAGEDETDVRDALLALIGSDPLIDATFVANGVDSIDIAAGELGDLWGLSVRGPATITAGTSALAAAQLGDVTASIELQAFSTTRYPTGGAVSILAGILGRLALPTARDVLDAYGLSVHGSGRVINLDALSGPDWESRAAVTLEIGMMSIAAEPADTIDDLDLGMEFRDVLPADVIVQIEANQP